MAGRPCLKLTLLNPDARRQDLLTVLEHVHRAGTSVRRAQGRSERVSA